MPKFYRKSGLKKYLKAGIQQAVRTRYPLALHYINVYWQTSRIESHVVSTSMQRRRSMSDEWSQQQRRRVKQKTLKFRADPIASSKGNRLVFFNLESDVELRWRCKCHVPDGVNDAYRVSNTELIWLQNFQIMLLFILKYDCIQKRCPVSAYSGFRAELTCES